MKSTIRTLSIFFIFVECRASFTDISLFNKNIAQTSIHIYRRNTIKTLSKLSRTVDKNRPEL